MSAASPPAGDPLVGSRVFFTRRARTILRGYWGQRWDELTIREAVTTPYTPKYHVASLHLSDRYVRLRGLDLLWFRGLFARGLHDRRGRFVQAPLGDPLTGLGPRQLVFPLVLLERLDALVLIGGPQRYTLATDRPGAVDPEGGPRDPRERVVLRVESFLTTVPPPLVLGWGRWSQQHAYRHATLCVRGVASNTALVGHVLTVPLGEVLWQQLRPPRTGDAGRNDGYAI